MSAGTWRRAPAVAGSFYPASGRELARRVAGHLEQGRFRALVARSAGLVSVKAVIVPHAGYQYSGPVAGTAFAAVAADARRIERVVLIGPSHFVGFDGVALSSAGCFTTPLGDVRLDADLPRALADLPGAVTLDRAHEREHSLEVELPFLQAVLGDFVLAPLVVGDASPATVGAVVGRLWGGEETLVVVSTDLSHYLDYERAREADAVTIDRIERRKHVGAHQACGYRAVNGLLEVLQTKDMNARALDTRNSGDTAGDRDRVVGYGAFVTGAVPVRS